MTHSKMWSDMFLLALPVAEKIVRPILVYLFLIAGLRLSGKRELAQLNPFDLIVLLTLSNTVQNAIIGDDNTVTGGIIGAATLLAMNYLMVRFLFKHPTLERLVEGDCAVLIRKGKIQHDTLTKEMLSIEELEAAARRQGFGSLGEVNEAILEPGGILTFTSRHPDPNQRRHHELLKQMEHISKQLAEMGPARPPAA